MREQDLPRDVYNLLSSSTKKEISQLSSRINTNSQVVVPSNGCYVLPLSRQALYDIQKCTKSAEENLLITQAKQEEKIVSEEHCNVHFDSSYTDFRQEQDKRAKEVELKRIQDKELRKNQKKSLLIKQMKENQLKKSTECIIDRSIFGSNGIWTKPQSNISNDLTYRASRSNKSGTNCSK